MASVQAFAADAVTLQLKWVTQAQFGGYYVAKDKGFYAEENLEVTINPGGPDIAPEQVIAGGGADVIVDWMAAALAAREKGVKLVNIAQPFKKAGPADDLPEGDRHRDRSRLQGQDARRLVLRQRVSVLCLDEQDRHPDRRRADGVTVLKQSFDVQPLIQKQADCISVMTYNEYGQALDAGFKPEDLTVFNYTDMGNDLLEDGLYVIEDNLKDPAFFDKMVRFVRASMKGWDYALANPDEAAQIVVDNGGQDLDHQKYMMGEVAKLVGGRQRRARRGRLRPHRQGRARPEDHHHAAGRRLDA